VHDNAIKVSLAHKHEP